MLKTSTASCEHGIVGTPGCKRSINGCYECNPIDQKKEEMMDLIEKAVVGYLIGFLARAGQTITEKQALQLLANVGMAAEIKIMKNS